MKFILRGIDSIQKTKVSEITKSELSFPTVNFKNASVEHVLKNSNILVNSIIMSCPIAGTYENILVDVKVHQLKKGQIPALPFWHIDGMNNPLNRFSDLNHLFISGISNTHFLSKDMEIDIEEGVPTVLDNIITEDGIPILENTIYTYTKHPHRATPATEDGTRLLVRVTESNYIKPNNKPFKVTYSGENYVGKIN